MNNIYLHDILRLIDSLDNKYTNGESVCFLTQNIRRAVRPDSSNYHAPEMSTSVAEFSVATQLINELNPALKSIDTKSLILMLTLVPCLNAADWPRFHGADATGVVESDARLPVHWSETRNVLWKTDVKGLDGSSLVMTDGKVFLTGVFSDKVEANEQPKAGLYNGRSRSHSRGQAPLARALFRPPNRRNAVDA